MDRRTFLSTMTAATLLARTWARAAENRRINPIGMQLYTVRKEMAQDFDGTLGKVAAIGYKEVEFAGYFGHDAKQVKASLNAVGLTSPSAHIDYKQVTTNLPAVLEAAHIVGHEYIVCPSIDEKVRHEPGIWQRTAEAFNRAGEEARKAGIQFAYHNHWFEFEKDSDGKLPYDILLSETKADLVKLEMDLFWIVKGGADPLTYFKRYPARFPLVHVKGRDPNGNMSSVNAENSIDWKKIFSHSEEAGIRHYFVEYDDPPDAFDSLKTSYQYLEQLRF
jgi:sugar phosphate isomerase/epimerase